MNVLIVGGNGFIGRAIAAAAAIAGHMVVSMSRTLPRDQEQARNGYVRCVGVNRNDLEAVTLLVQEHQIDVVVDVIAMTLATTQPLLNALDGKIQQYVLLSSADVYRNYELLQKTSTGAAEAITDEASPLRVTRFPYRGATARRADAADAYLDAYDKIPIEAAVQSMRSDWTILRLPMVYGPGDRQQRFAWAIAPMLSQRERIVIPTSWARWTSTYGYVDEVAAAITSCVGHPAARREVFNIAEPAPQDHAAWALEIAQILDWRGQLELSDDPENKFAQQLAGMDLTVPFHVSGAKLRAAIPAAEHRSRRDCLRLTIDAGRLA